MTESIAKQWLADIVSTAQQRDYDIHMNLISKNVSVFGIPGFEQTKHAFKQGVIDEGTQYARGNECLLEKEPDGQWRLVRQRILGNDETNQYLPELSGVK